MAGRKLHGTHNFHNAISRAGTGLCVMLQNLIGLTNEQTHDMVSIRRLYMTKRASLDKQRKAVVRQMGESEQQGCHPSDSFVALSLLAEQAKDITAKDFKVYCTVVSGLYQGVRPAQLAHAAHRLFVAAQVAFLQASVSVMCFVLCGLDTPAYSEQ